MAWFGVKEVMHHAGLTDPIVLRKGLRYVIGMQAVSKTSCSIKDSSGRAGPTGRRRPALPPRVRTVRLLLVECGTVCTNEQRDG